MKAEPAPSLDELIHLIEQTAAMALDTLNTYVKLCQHEKKYEQKKNELRRRCLLAENHAARLRALRDGMPLPPLTDED